jgi:hypothetical protein
MWGVVMSRFFEVPLLLAAAVFARLCDAEDGEELVRPSGR